MATGMSIFLVALGAILTWAVSATVQGIDINVVGVILMLVGGIGLIMSLLFWSSLTNGRRDRAVILTEEHDLDRPVIVTQREREVV